MLQKKYYSNVLKSGGGHRGFARFGITVLLRDEDILVLV